MKCYGIIAAFFIPAALSSQVTYLHNGMRSGDLLEKQQTMFKDPGRSGSGVVWDFSDLEFVNPRYKVRYEPPMIVDDSLYVLGKDTFHVDSVRADELIVGIEHGTQYYYRQDSCGSYLLGHENPRTLLHYLPPVGYSAYSLAAGEVRRGTYRSEGLYSTVDSLYSEGSYSVENDAEGIVVLPEGDTVYQAVRQKSVRRMNYPVRGGSFSEDSVSERVDTEVEQFRWYGEGYRYPVFETYRTYHVCDTVREVVFETAFFYPPQNHCGLYDDADNESRRQKRTAAENRVCGVSGFSYNVYPNPVVGRLYVEWLSERTERVILTLYDVSGKAMRCICDEVQPTGVGRHEVDFSGMPAGTYFLQLTAGEKKYGEKIVKR